MNVDGKIAMITGASSGLGAAPANLLIFKGDIVYGLAHTQKLYGGVATGLLFPII